MFSWISVRVGRKQIEKADAPADLSQIKLEVTPVGSADLRVDSADVVHSVQPTDEQLDELKRSSLEQASALA
jgi:hypothetical protein